METLKNVYYDTKTGFGGVDKLYRKVKELDPSITIKQVKDFLDKQESYQITKRSKPTKQFQSITAPYKGYNFQIDLLIYSNYEIDKYKYILVVVDTYSRYCVCRPLTNRENPTLINALQSIFDEMKVVPERVNCDNEFNTTLINNFWKKHNIRVFYSDPDEVNKNSIVERLNRTLRELLHQFRLASQGKRKWYKYLPDLVDNYNNNTHSTIKEKPIDVWNGKAKNRQIINVADYTPFDIGDKVRIRIIKKVFDKGSEINYSKDVYTIRDKTGNKYFLSDDNGINLRKGYKPYELKRSNEIQFNETAPDNDEPVIQKPKVLRSAQRAQKELLTRDEPQPILSSRRIRTRKDFSQYAEWSDNDD
jgi:hypothetical protein